MVLYPLETETYLQFLMKDKLKEKPFFADAVPNPQDQLCPWKLSSNPATHDVYKESLGKVSIFAMHVYYYYHNEPNKDELDFAAFHVFCRKILEKVHLALEGQCDQDTALESFHLLVTLESTLLKFKPSLIMEHITDKTLTECKVLFDKIAELCKGENTSIEHMKLVKFFIANLDLDYDLLTELRLNMMSNGAKKILSAQKVTMFDTDETFAEMSSLYFIRPHYTFYMADEEDPHIEAAPTTYQPLGGGSEPPNHREEDGLSTFKPDDESIVSKSTLDNIKRIEQMGKSEIKESPEEMDKLIMKLNADFRLLNEKEGYFFQPEEIRFILVAITKILQSLRLKFVQSFAEIQLQGYALKIEEIINNLRIIDIIKTVHPVTVENLLSEYEEFCSEAEPITFSATLNILCTVIVNWINAERKVVDVTRMNRSNDWIKIKLHHIQLFLIAHQIPATERKLWADLLPVGVDGKKFVQEGVCSRCSKPMNYDFFYVLLCGHSICKGCLEKLEQARDESVSCSTCEKPFREVVPSSRLQEVARSLHSSDEQAMEQS